MKWIFRIAILIAAWAVPFQCEDSTIMMLVVFAVTIPVTLFVAGQIYDASKEN